jgi:hypothetical protein
VAFVFVMLFVFYFMVNFILTCIRWTIEYVIVMEHLKDEVISL